MPEIITDLNSEFSNYTIVSNLIDELDLSPLAIALYFHYKRWANAKSKRPLSVKDLMQKYKVDSRAIKAAKIELQKNELITIDKTGRHLGKPDDIHILDITKRNFEYFADKKQVVNEQQPSCYPTTRPVVNQQPDPLLDNNAIKEKDLKEKEEKETHTHAGGETPLSAAEEVFCFAASIPCQEAISAANISDLAAWRAVLNNHKAGMTDGQWRNLSYKQKAVQFALQDYSRQINKAAGGRDPSRKLKNQYTTADYGDYYDKIYANN